MDINDKIKAEGHLEVIKKFSDGTEELVFEDHNVICSGLGQSIAEWMTRAECTREGSAVDLSRCGDIMGLPGFSNPDTSGGDMNYTTPAYDYIVCCFKIVTIEGKLCMTVSPAGGGEDIALLEVATLSPGDSVSYSWKMKACGYKWCGWSPCNGKSVQIWGDEGFGELSMDCGDILDVLNSNRGWDNVDSKGQGSCMNTSFKSAKQEGCCDMEGHDPADRTSAGGCIEHEGNDQVTITAEFLRDCENTVILTTPDYNNPGAPDIDITLPPVDGVVGAIKDQLRGLMGIGGEFEPPIPSTCPHPGQRRLYS
jgi:hypothetical protein